MPLGETNGVGLRGQTHSLLLQQQHERCLTPSVAQSGAQVGPGGHPPWCNGRSPSLLIRGSTPDHPVATMRSTNTRTPTSDPERTAGGDGADFVAATYPGPFRCPLCVTINSVAHNFLEHMRSHAKEVRFLCGKCSKVCPTIHSVACHYSKCGRPVTRSVRQPRIAVEDRPHTVACTDCGERFTTAMGMQLHRRSAHPEEFNADRPREKKARWSKFEVLALAKLEAQLPANITNVNQILSKQLLEVHGLTRNVEMIKGQRRKSQYKELVASLKSADRDADRGSSEPTTSHLYGSAVRVRSADPAHVHVSSDDEHVLPDVSTFPASETVLPPEQCILSRQSATSSALHVLSHTEDVLPGKSTVPMPEVLSVPDSVLPGKSTVPMPEVLSVPDSVLPGESTIPTPEVLSVPDYVLSRPSVSVLPTELSILPNAATHGPGVYNQQASHDDSEMELLHCLKTVLREASCCEAPAGSLLQ
ncbi:hypothetical protein TTRE_0000946601, partial [Trichuris trichiura]